MEATALPRPASLRLEGSLIWLLPLAVVSVACAAFVVADLQPVDLAASVYRARLFADHGFALWNGNWYGGHYTLSYSVLAPPLTWLVGSVTLAIACAVISTGLFQLLARRHFGKPALIGSIWFALAASTLVYHGRVTFGAGVVLALAALLALQRDRDRLALVPALLCGLVSPVAALFLALAGVSVALAHGRRAGWWLAAAAIVPVLAIQVAFPEGGQQPYRMSDLGWLLVTVAIVLFLLPRSERALRLGAWLYALGGTAAYILNTPLGNNVCRLAPLVAGPLVACALAAYGRRRHALLVAGMLALLVYFQWKPVYEDVDKVQADPAVQASYFRPLIGFLERERAAGAPFRVEIPFTQAHWEAAEVARRFPLARGWERQLDGTRDALFYGGVLNRVTYGTWLAEHGVRFVALPSGKPDYSSRKERGLIESGLPYLRLVWRSKEWRVYEVTLPHSIVFAHGDADMSLVSLGNEELAIDVRRPGEAAVKVHWSPYWRAYGGCMERDGQWTRVIATRPGRLRMAIDFSPERIVAHGRRCG